MGLLDNLFKPKPESGPEKPVENSGILEPGGQSEPGAAHAGTGAAKAPSFLAPKVYVPRSSVQIVPPTRGQLQTERKLEPAAEAPGSAQEIILTLGDVLSRIPTHFLRQGTPDARRELRFPADALAADIARGRATVFLADIVAQCPDIFMPAADGFDDIQIRLPLQKLVEQIALSPASISAAHHHAERHPALPIMPPQRMSAEASQILTSPFQAPNSSPQVEDQIHLGLAAVLKRCPKEIIVRPLPPIDESVRITFPFQPIERQLATGQVEVSSLRFIAALPLDLMKCFEARAGVKVPLPLEEIFQNLPAQPPQPEIGPSSLERDRTAQNAKLAESILLEPMDAPEETGTSVSDTDVLLSELSALASAPDVVISANFGAKPPAEWIDPKAHASAADESREIAPPAIPSGLPPSAVESTLPWPPPVSPVEVAPHSPPSMVPDVHTESPAVETRVPAKSNAEMPVAGEVPEVEAAISAPRNEAPEPLPPTMAADVPPIDLAPPAPAMHPIVPSLRPPILLHPDAGANAPGIAPHVSPTPEPPSPTASSIPVNASVVAESETPGPPQAVQLITESVAPEPSPATPESAPVPPTPSTIDDERSEPDPAPLDEAPAAPPAELRAAPLRIAPPQFRPVILPPPRVVASPFDTSTPAPAPATPFVEAARIPEAPVAPAFDPDPQISHIAPEPPAAAQPSTSPRTPEVRPASAPFTLDGKVREIFASDTPLELAHVSLLLAALPGIRGCIIAAHALESLSGQLPASLDAAAIRDISRRMHGALADRGNVQHITLHADDYSLSLFTRGEACVCAVHRARIFLPGVCEKFTAVAEELSRIAR